MQMPKWALRQGQEKFEEIVSCLKNTAFFWAGVILFSSLTQCPRPWKKWNTAKTANFELKSGPVNQPPKYALVTGATSGIGREIAVGLIHNGFQVLAVGRRAKALDELKQAYPSHLHTFQADFSDLEQVKRLAHEYPFEKLDVLVHNAGGANGSRQLGAQGYELTWVVNYLCPYLLTQLLEPQLRKSSSARIIHLASTAHYHGKLDWKDLQAERGYFILKAYAQSKLAQIMHARHLSTLWVRHDDPKVYAVHPGVVKTNIGSKNSAGWIGAIWHLITRIKGVSVQKGADNTLWLATLTADALPASGSYFHQRKAVRPSAQAKNAADAERLYLETAKALADFLV
jgi:NAD(P)-dependent dehydrogenase (short-subunit alcohol dehydrogenase family)